MAWQTDAQAPLLALCTSPDGHLSMYHVSLNSLLYFQRYALNKLFIAKIKKGSNSVNTGDRVMDFAFCHFLYGPLSVYQVSFTPDWSPAYLFEVVFVKCVYIWRTSVFFQFYGVLGRVLYNYSAPTFFFIQSHTFAAENCAIGNIVK